jgi:hypothetical protein
MDGTAVLQVGVDFKQLRFGKHDAREKVNNFKE